MFDLNRILLLLIIVSPFSFSCEIGKYEAIVMSEYSIELELRESGEMVIIHKNWLPGDSIIGEEHRYTGYWKCIDKLIKLEYSIETITGRVVELSLDKIYGIKKSSTGITFEKSEEKGSIVGGWRFWPKEFLSEAFR